MQEKVDQMVITDAFNFKDQVKCYKYHKNNIDEIYEIYWKKVLYLETGVTVSNGIVVDTSKQKEKFLFMTKEIMAKFEISMHELIFLLRQHPENKKIRCEYCKDGFIMATRTNSYSSSCGHTGICQMDGCNEASKYLYCKACNVKQRVEYEAVDDLPRKYKPKEEHVISYDLVTEDGYVICIKSATNDLVKVELTAIKNIQEHTENSCLLYTDRFNLEGYITWMSAADLEEIINSFPHYIA